MRAIAETHTDHEIVQQFVTQLLCGGAMRARSTGRRATSPSSISCSVEVMRSYLRSRHPVISCAGVPCREQPASGTFRKAFLAHFGEGLFDLILNLLGWHIEVMRLRCFKTEMKELPAHRISDKLRNRALTHAGLRQMSP